MRHIVNIVSVYKSTKHPNMLSVALLETQTSLLHINKLHNKTYYMSIFFIDTCVTTGYSWLLYIV